MNIKKQYLILIFLVGIVVTIHFLPKIEFNKPYSYVLYSNDGQLLDYQVADDGQWRMKMITDTLPYKYINCLLLQEDKNFFFHHGVDYLALLRALYLNIKHNKKVSGGSTITMQVSRIYLGNKPRTLWQKIKEILLAYYIELKYDKKDILLMYMQHAPFGGNVVGTEAASFKYFNRPLQELSWSESALLAVLPKNPSNINVKKNIHLLFSRRNRLLRKLYHHHIIDQKKLQLSINDEIKITEQTGTHFAPHLLQHLKTKYPLQYTYHTYINYHIQQQSYEILNRYRKENEANDIRNAAVLICELPSKKIITYIGNFHEKGKISDAYNVNMIESRRSGGSILKPLLYATMLNQGELTSNMLLPDIPIQIGSYSPKNFNLSYDGAVKANQALARSLNVPFVKLLQNYGIQRFIDFLHQMNFSTITQSQDYYGLSLILGGCEIKMSELLNAFANMSNHLTNNSVTENLQYFLNMPNANLNIPLSKGSIWLTFQAMNEVERPKNYGYWYLFKNKLDIAWKTGTSFGFRDAWAIGVTPEYAVLVWVGNATGKSSPELTGIKKAAPILFDIFSILPHRHIKFTPPYDDLQIIKVCKQSGYLPSPFCKELNKEIVCKTSLKIKTCPYHKLVYLDTSGNFRVNSDCESVQNIVTQSFFVLPPTMEFFYKRKNPTYKTLPPLREDCKDVHNAQSNIDIVYPQIYTNLYIPRNLDGTLSSIIFEATHRQSDAIIYWYLDGTYIQQTQWKHTISLQPSVGKHELLLQDELGEIKRVEFNVVYSPK
ncbi:MAG: penicillin-binding protein 1C [Bacteroidales bacterium]|nr:penicillin-binding protein 1C [Bacteroidales bacterium]